MPPGRASSLPVPEAAIARRAHTRLALAAVLVAVGVLAVVAGGDLLERRRTQAEIRTLRGEVADARAEAEGCRAALARQESSFRRFDLRVDSLEAEVRRYEALDERGVPRSIYPEYLERVERFNDSVAAWEERAEGLRAAGARCRLIVEGHNALADSLRARLEALAPGDGEG